MTTRVYDITPKPRLLASIQRQDMPTSVALAELIDNSFDAEATTVRISWDYKNLELTISDDGVGVPHMHSMITLGVHENEGRKTSGKFGVGGIEACLALGLIVDIRTARANRGVIECATLDYEEIKESGNWCARGREEPANGVKSFTEVKIRKVQKTIQPSVIMESLSRDFAPALWSGKRILIGGKDVVAPKRPRLIDHISGYSEYMGKEFWFEAGVLPEGSKERGGWHVALNHRMVKNGVSLGCRDYSPSKFYGFIELRNSQEKWDVNKHKTDASEIERVCEELFPKVEHLLQKAEQSENVTLENSVAMEATDDLNEAMSVIYDAKEKRERKGGNGSSRPAHTGRRRITVSKAQDGEKTLRLRDSLLGKKFRIHFENSERFARVDGNRMTNTVYLGSGHPYWKNKSSKKDVDRVKLAAIWALVMHASLGGDESQQIFKFLKKSDDQYLRAFDSVDTFATTLSKYWKS